MILRQGANLQQLNLFCGKLNDKPTGDLSNSSQDVTCVMVVIRDGGTSHWLSQHIESIFSIISIS